MINFEKQKLSNFYLTFWLIKSKTKKKSKKLLITAGTIQTKFQNSFLFHS